MHLTLISVFSSEVEDIPAIAILNSGKGESCCDHDDGAYGVDGGVDTLQALHGFDRNETIHDYRYGGCPGLKEVFVVVKSKLWPPSQAQIDNSVALRPATNGGLTKGQIQFGEMLKRQIVHVRAEGPLFGVGPDVWIGEKKPRFRS
jgi:hypothetical protein